MRHKKRIIGWLLGLLGLGLVVLGYVLMGGTLEEAKDYVRAYTQQGTGWLVLLGLVLMFLGFLFVARKYVRRSPPQT